MAGLDREVELQIRAQDYSDKTIKEVKNNLKKLRDEFAKQSQAAQTGQADIAKYEQTIKELVATTDQLATLRKQAKNFEELGKNINDMRTQLSKLQADEVALQNTIAQTGAATKAQAGALKHLQSSITSLTSKIDKADTAWNKQRLELELLGVSTRDLVKEQNRLSLAQQIALRMLANQRNAQKSIIATQNAATAAIEAQTRALERQAQASRAANAASKVNSSKPTTNAIRQSTSDALRNAQMSNNQRATQSLGGMASVIQSSNRIIQTGTQDLKEYENALNLVGNASQRLKTLANLADTFQRQKEAVDKTGAEYQQLLTEFKQLEKALTGTGAVTKQQEARFNELAARLQNVSARLTQERTELAQTRAELQQAGVSTKNFAGTQQQLINMSNQLAATQNNLQNALARTRQQQEAQAQAAKAAALAQQQAALQNAIRQQTQAISQQRQSLIDLVNIERQRIATQSQLASAIQNALNPQRKYLETLQATAQTIVSTRTVYRNTESDINELRAAQERLVASQKRLQQIAGQIDDYQRQKQAVVAMRTEYNQLRQKANQLAQTLRSGNGTQQQVAEYQRLIQTMNRMGAEYAQSRVALDRMDAELRQAGVQTNNLAQSQQRLIRSARASTNALNQLNAAIQNNIREQRNLNGSFGRGINASRTSLDFFQRLRGQVLALTSAYIGLYGAIGLFNKVIQAGKDGYQLKLYTEILADPESAWGKETTASGMEKYFRDTAERMGLRLQDVINDGGKFFMASRDSGIKMNQAQFTFEQFSGLGSLMGVDKETQAGIMKALTQMFAKGKVQAEELRGQLGDRMPQAVSLFTKALGVTSAEFEKMLKDGKVTSDVILQAGQQIEKTYGKQMQKAFSTLTSEQNRLSNSFQNWLRLINDAGVAENFKQLVIELTQFFKSDTGKEWAMRIAEGLNVVINGLRWCVKNANLLITVFGALFATFAIQAVAALAIGFMRLAANMNFVKKAAKGALEYLLKFARVLPAAGMAGMGFVQVLALIVKAFARLFVFVTIGKAILQTFEKLSGEAITFESVFRNVVDAIILMFDVMDMLLDGLTTAIAYVAETISDVFVAILGDSKTASEESSKLWGASLGNTEGGFTGLLQVASNVMDAIVAAVKSAVIVAGGWLDVLVRKLKLEDASFDEINAAKIYDDIATEQSKNGFAARLNARIASRKAQPQKQSIGGGTKLTDLSTNKTPDAEEDEKAQQRIEKEREKAERAREKAEQAALKRLEKQLEYQKAIQWYLKSAQGLLKAEQDSGNYAAYMKRLYAETQGRYAASYVQPSSVSTSAPITQSFSEFDKSLTASLKRNAVAFGGTIHGECAKGVRVGLEKAFGTRLGGLGNGNQLIGNLVRSGKARQLGYKEIAFDPRTYVPQVGDIMSLSRTSTRAGSRAGHVAIRGTDSWYADGKQNRAIGNTIAFKEQDYRNILNGKITVRVLRLANKSGKELPIGGKQPVTADDWKAEKRESQFAQNAESFMEKADDLQAEILKRAREQSADLLRNNGITVEALMNRAEIDVRNPLSVDEISNAFERLIKPDFDRQAEETAALLYAQLKEDVGTEQARAMFDAYLPKVKSLYNEKAKEELGKIIDERFSAIVEKGNIQSEASDNYLNALKAQVLAGTLAPDEAMRKMQRFQEGITAEIKRQIAAIDAFLSSEAAKNLPAPQLAKMQMQREELAAKIGSGSAGSPNAAREQADAMFEAQVSKINAELEQRKAQEELLITMYRNGQITQEAYYAKLNEQMSESDVRLQSLVASAQQLQAAFGGVASASATLALENATNSATVSIGKLNQEQENAKAINEELKNGFVSTFKAGAQAIAGMVTGQKTLADGFMDVMAAFGQWAADFLMKIAEMILQQLILNALQGAFGGASMTGGLGGAMASVMTGITAAKRHNGGLAEQGVGRSYSPLVFANAPRYHTGGIVGLQPNEVPAILQRGEEVLTKQDPRHRNNGGASGSSGSEQPITVVNSFDPIDALGKALASTKGRKVLIKASSKERKAFRSFR